MRRATVRKAPTLPAKTAYALRRLLTSRDVFGTLDTRAGRLNPRRLVRAMAGAETVFTQRTHVPATRTALSILIDLSGSMCGRNIQGVTDFITAVGPTLDRSVGCVWQVLGFKTTWVEAIGQSATNNGIDTTDIQTHGIPVAQESAGLYRFKPFATPYSRIKGKLERALINAPNGGTPDYPAIYQCILDLLQRPEERRVLMVMTDGYGDVTAVRDTCLWAQGRGVEVLGIGIGSGIVDQVYPHHATAPYAQQLLATSLPALADTIIKARIQRGEA